MQAGAGQSADAKREWANAVLEALRAQSKMPGQASLPPPSPGKGPTQNPDTSSPSGAPNPSAGSSAGPHAAAQPGTYLLALANELKFGEASWQEFSELCWRALPAPLLSQYLFPPSF